MSAWRRCNRTVKKIASVHTQIKRKTRPKQRAFVYMKKQPDKVWKLVSAMKYKDKKGNCNFFLTIWIFFPRNWKFISHSSEKKVRIESWLRNGEIDVKKSEWQDIKSQLHGGKISILNWLFFAAIARLYFTILRIKSVLRNVNSKFWGRKS